MRRVVLVCLALIGIGVAEKAPAADLQSPALPNWSGVYLGGAVGLGWSHTDWTPVDNTTLWGDAAPWDSMSDSMDGVVGGLQAGFDYQVGQWTVGLEAQVFAASLSSDFRYRGTAGAGDDQFENKIDTLILATVRVGHTFDQWLGYVKAGYAFAQVKTSVSDTVGPNVGSGSSTEWQTGPTVGVGLEYALTPNVSIGLEYDYVWLNDATHELGDSTGSYPWKVDLDAQLFMARLNYRLPIPR